MIDFDGIERPDDTGAHMLAMPFSAPKKIKTPKDILNRNPAARFFGYILRVFVYIVLNILYAFLYRFRELGQNRRRALKGSPVVVVSNHCHTLDITLTPVRFMPRMLYITSRLENFSIPVLGGLIRALGAVPIPYDLKAMRMFDEAVSGLLADKKAVMFLPEAAMWPRYRDLRPFKKGAFRYAVRADAPVLPAVVTIRNVRKSLKKTRRRLTLTYLAPVYPDPTLPEPAAIQKLMTDVHKKMRAYILVSRVDDVYTRRYRRQYARISAAQKAAEQV
ncbi:MAG: 1-acyl-sn-glycerol-3-phosphate acyltransferase [Clostridiales bacterium]|jgi:1-acyl-sn-glycerol-3-phosphate acyltransferase|nr:1-acyl-sn-glycerol-3-phosphate acyltransferase [Clostridiales bacterium]